MGDFDLSPDTLVPYSDKKMWTIRAADKYPECIDEYLITPRRPGGGWLRDGLSCAEYYTLNDVFREEWNYIGQSTQKYCVGSEGGNIRIGFLANVRTDRYDHRYRRCRTATDAFRAWWFSFQLLSAKRL